MEDFIISKEMVINNLQNLHELQDEMSGPLTNLFNLSLNKSILPSDWKLSIVTALFTKVSKSLINNYRPVSLTSIVCKILESIIVDKLMNYLTSNNLISNKQYGFINGRSTSLQLLNLLDKWTKHLDNNREGVDIIYTDFEKAFDKVPHKRLLFKLKRVRIDNKYSKWNKVTSGIPQGSVLGPILFIIYINDLPDICPECVDLTLFADDAKMSKTLVNLDDKLQLQTTLNKIVIWSKYWLLSLNINKCVALNLKMIDSPISDYFIETESGNYKLQNVTSTKDLSAIIDNKLTFKEHISEKIKKQTAWWVLLKEILNI